MEPITLAGFWQWAYSDLLDNTNRGAFAEYLVYSSLYPDTPGQRHLWSPYDILSPSGRRVEVKSAAYLQSWSGDDPSQIFFDIAPKRAWHPDTGYAPYAERNSDLYIFALYTSMTRSESPLDLSLWEFYLLPTSVLDRICPGQKRISLPSLLEKSPLKVPYEALGASIEALSLKGGDDV